MGVGDVPDARSQSDVSNCAQQKRRIQLRAANMMYPNARTILRATNSTQLITRNQMRATVYVQSVARIRIRAVRRRHCVGGGGAVNFGRRRGAAPPAQKI